MLNLKDGAFSVRIASQGQFFMVEGATGKAPWRTFAIGNDVVESLCQFKAFLPKEFGFGEHLEPNGASSLPHSLAGGSDIGQVLCGAQSFALVTPFSVHGYWNGNVSAVGQLVKAIAIEVGFEPDFEGAAVTN